MSIRHLGDRWPTGIGTIARRSGVNQNGRDSRIVLHYNARCPDCVRRAERTARLDWLGRVELSTDPSPLGQVPIGEIVVVDRQLGRVFTGVFATRMVSMRIPLFMPYGVLLYLPWIRRLAGGRNPGCNGDACEL